jgi:hypothetical protein
MANGAGSVKSNRQIIVRRHLVCVRSECCKCQPYISQCPANCEYGILHLLEKDGGVKDMERRTGKTTRLLGIAHELVSAGYTVYWIAFSSDAAKQAKSLFNPSVNGKIVFVSALNKSESDRGRPGCVLADDIDPSVL